MASTKSKLIKKSTRSDLITYAMVLVVFAVVEILKSTGNISSLLRGLLVPLCMYSILAVSLNLVVGYLGELSLGHAGFMCVGAYASSIFSVVTQNTLTNAWIRFPLAILVGGLCAAIFGVLIGIPVLRLKGDYLAIVTLAFGEIIKNILGTIYVGYDSHGIHASFTSQSSLNLEADGTVLINGPLGITGTPNDSTFVIGIVLLLITLFVILNFIHSRAGRAVMSLRDNRIAAESVGISVTKYKLIAFSLSAFFAGIAGVLYSHNLSVLAATSKNFGYNMDTRICSSRRHRQYTRLYNRSVCAYGFAGGSPRTSRLQNAHICSSAYCYDDNDLKPQGNRFLGDSFNKKVLQKGKR